MEALGSAVNNSFFFVIDKIIDLQGFFIGQAMAIGKIVFLIAVLSAALNYALTGQGLKENIIKILKAVVFFLIVIAAYPRIIGFISFWTFDMAEKSIYPSVNSYFNEVTSQTERDYVDYDSRGRTFAQETITEILRKDNSRLFEDLSTKRSTSQMTYTTVTPAAVFKIIFLVAGDCFTFADDPHKKWGIFPEFSRILKGLICGFFIVFTGIFALLEYMICFLEFMLVATVGVILFPLSIWEGSKFLAEKFIGAIVGFFIKLLFCNLAIFLMIYGFVSLFYYFSGNGFNGEAYQIVFIILVCMMFYFICKSAPGLAQSLLTGTPSLNAAGAIAAAGGAVAAAGATMGLAKKAASAAGKVGGAAARGTAKTAFNAGGALVSANSALKTAKSAGAGNFEQAGAFVHSLGESAKKSMKAGALGLTRNLLGEKSNGSSGGGGRNPFSEIDNFLKPNNDGTNKTIGEYVNDKKQEGAKHGREYMDPSLKAKNSPPPTASPESSPNNKPA